MGRTTRQQDTPFGYHVRRSARPQDFSHSNCAHSMHTQNRCPPHEESSAQAGGIRREVR